jgi:4-hydroxy-3-polyprenylbenzoate decarboxylase
VIGPVDWAAWRLRREAAIAGPDSNLGVYRIPLSGGGYEPNKEIGLYYQIHRSIGVHHPMAESLGKPLEVNVFVGGRPSMSLAFVMPLPKGMSELIFAS